MARTTISDHSRSSSPAMTDAALLPADVAPSSSAGMAPEGGLTWLMPPGSVAAPPSLATRSVRALLLHSGLDLLLGCRAKHEAL